MFSERDLQELFDFTPERPILSLYLNTKTSEGTIDVAKLHLHNMLKSVNLPKDVQATEQYSNMNYDWKSQSLAIFSCADQGFFRAYPLSVPVNDQVQTTERPVVRPMIHIMETYGYWGIVLVDKQGARLFSFHLGDLEEVGGFLGEEIKQIKRGGASSVRGRKGGSNNSANIENIIDRNMDKIAEYAGAFFKTKHIRRIMIGGSDDNIVRFKESLPKSWQSLVAASFPLSMTSDHSEILERAFQIAKEAEHGHQSKMVKQAIILAAKGSNGVIGLNDTLNAIHTGQAQTVLVLESYSEHGFRCTGCGFMTTQALALCPFCSGTFIRIDDAVEMSVRVAKQKNASVLIIPENNALKEAGAIAAILRY